MKKHEIILNMINNLFTLWSNHCDHFDVWRQNKNENEKTSSMRHKTNVEFKINFEKINSTDLSIIILKRTSSSFSSVKKKEEKKKIVSKIEKNVVRILKIKSNKKIKRTSKNSRSKECLTSSNIIFVSVVAYNFLSKQKNVKLFVIFLRNINDQF